MPYLTQMGSIQQHFFQNGSDRGKAEHSSVIITKLLPFSPFNPEIPGVPK